MCGGNVKGVLPTKLGQNLLNSTFKKENGE